MKIKYVLSITMIGAIAISCNVSNNSTGSNTQVQNSSFSEKPMVINIDEKEVIEYLNNQKGDYEIIDVRTPQEVNNGFLKGTKHFININGNDFSSKISALDKTKTYIVYCHSGARSSSAANKMIQQGFTVVYNLKGGLMNWREASYITR